MAADGKFPPPNDYVSLVLKQFNDIEKERFQAASKSGDILSSSFGLPTSIPRHAAYHAAMTKYPHLRELLSAIESDLNKFQYGKHTIEEWNRRYIFPSPRTIKHYATLVAKRAVGYSDGADQLIINKDRNTVQAWLDSQIVADLRTHTASTPPISVLLGDVGCGKSTFTKYAINTFREFFVRSRIIPSRIECRKLLAWLQQKHKFPPTIDTSAVFVPILNSFIVRDMFRDIIHFVYADTADGVTYTARKSAQVGYPDIFSDDFVSYCNEVDQPAIAAFEKTSNFCEEIRERVRSYIEKDSGEKPPALAQSFDDAKGLAITAIVVSFFVKHGVDFALFFDGFDYIQLADFVYPSPQARLLELLRDWLRGGTGDSYVPLPATPYRVAPKIVISLRYCTFGEFNARYSQALGRSDRLIHHIAPPSLPWFYHGFFEKIQNRFIKRKDVKKVTHELMGLLNVVRQSIRKELNLCPEYPFGDLFNGNVRHQVNFTRDVLVEIIYETLIHAPRGFETSVEELAVLLQETVRSFAHQKRYRFIELLLYSMSNRFSNFVAIPDLEKLEEVSELTDEQVARLHELIRDNNYDSGYVANIFNYHVQYRNISNIGYILEKVRILRLLFEQASDAAIRTRGLTEPQLRLRFSEYNWPISPLFKLSLYLLTREGFLFIEGGTSGKSFRITPLGILAIRRLVRRLSYLENVYFGTLLPANIRDHSLDVSRTPSTLRDWVTASIFHLYMLLRLIHQAESSEPGSGAPEPKRFLFKRIFEPVIGEVQAILQADAVRAARSRQPERTYAYSVYELISRSKNIRL